MSTVKIDFVPHFGAFVIETLTLGMYGESRNAIREYVQNCRDSLLQAIDDKLITADQARIDVEMDADRNGLTIRDNGHGIRVENAAKVLASIGASNKDYRRNAGFRGIGRLAGIVFCDRLIFRTKSKGQKQFTEVVIRADELREKLSPEETYAKDAAQTLAECVDATLQDDADADAHYFEVRLEGFHNPPAECLDVELMRTFLGQVAPLPYAAEFPFAGEIEAAALKAGVPVESVHLFIKGGDAAAIELFKPYGSDVAVKRTRTPISVSFEASPTGKWFGWLGRKRVSGAIKEKHAGIRVRVRNIQIDDTKIIRDIFAESRLASNVRTSWGRFAEWYVGEIFVDPQAAVPNARRDGFEENQSWSTMRDELDLQVATPLGKLAYRTSKADKLSPANLTAAMDALEAIVDQLEVEANPTMERLETPLFTASDLRSRLASAKGLYEGDEAAQLDALAVRLAAVQLRLKDAPPDAVRRAVDVLRPVAQARGVAFLLNDDPALAAQTGCDGAHVGQEDTPVPEARRTLGELTLGVTCHDSRDLAMRAGEDGADYVAFGAFFPTATKAPPAMAEPDIITWWSDLMEIPCVAIGGITAANCAPLVQAGADFLAVVGAVWSHPDGPAEGVRAMNRAIQAARP